MNAWRKTSLLLLLAAAALAFGAASPAAFSQGANPVTDSEAPRLEAAARQASGAPAESDRIVVREVPVSEELAAERLWTREELLNAKPLPLPEFASSDVTAADGLQVFSSEMGMAPSGLPSPEARVLAEKLFPDDWAHPNDLHVADDLGQAESMGYSYPPPFSRYPANGFGAMWTDFPWKTIGRLFFTIPGQGNHFCSGAVGARRAVWTTGHCVYTPGRGWHTNMVFVPAYRAGAQPYGQFTSVSMAAPGYWTHDGNRAYDMGMVAVRDRSGHPISWWTGWLGFKYNQSSTQHFHAFGYPSNIGSSRYSIACVASTSTTDPISGPDPIAIGCDMGSGISGGPWILTYKPYQAGAMNYVNGVFSYYKSSRPLESYSTYFGSYAKDLWDWGWDR